MSTRFALLSLATLVVATGWAQDAPAKRTTETSVWEVYRLDAQGELAPIGSETVEIVRTADRLEIASTTGLKLGPQPLDMTQRLVVDAEGTFVRYRLSSQTHTLTCERTDAGITLRGQVMGGEQERTLEPKGLVICLDNLAWSHYDVLGLHAAKRGKPFDFTALVPQALLGIPARFTPGAETEVSDGEATRRAREGKLTVSGLLVEFVYDQGNGRAYEIRVPSQRLLARRGSWRLTSEEEPVAAVELPAGLRELELTLPTPGYDPGLPAKLTVPAGDGPFVGALLLSGSGPNDLDETIGPNKPLRDVAWQLAAHGVASLRFTKRTRHVLDRMKRANGAEQQALSEQLAGMGLEEEYLADAQAALVFLRARPEVRDDALVVVGHSQGALMAPEIAAAGETQGVVLLAGPGRTLDVVIEDQILSKQLRLGVSEEEARAATAEALRPLEGLAERDAPEGRFMGASLAYWKDVFTRDPVAGVRGLAQPVCVVWGERDIQVTRPDFEALERVYTERQNPRDGLLRYPTLNHLFMPCDEGAAGEEYATPARVDPRVGEQVATWIHAATKGE